jgi:hypothetical protein
VLSSARVPAPGLLQMPSNAWEMGHQNEPYAEWWDSASQTIFSFDKTQIPPEMSEWFDMWQTVARARFTPNWTDEDEARAAYERHNAEVRASVPPDRLLEWQARDGWGPLCLGPRSGRT